MTRPLHFVFKICDRLASLNFYKDVLRMQVLRHEEFSEGCKASCNGPYDSRWSKTMIGYGSEDINFVFELTYNYGINAYRKGNDFVGIWIHDNDLFNYVKQCGAVYEIESPDVIKLVDPDNHTFFIAAIQTKDSIDVIHKVALHVSELTNSIEYWHSLLGMDVVSHDVNCALLAFSDNKTKLELISLHGKPVDRAEAFGRIAFAVPENELPVIQEKILKAKREIINPLLELETPGKATVKVVIIADPDGHEICFVNEEGFRDLSAFDPDADYQLRKMIAAEDRRKQKDAPNVFISAST